MSPATDPDDRLGFGALLKRHRLLAGLSREVLAEQARLSAQALSSGDALAAALADLRASAAAERPYGRRRLARGAGCVFVARERRSSNTSPPQESGRCRISPKPRLTSG